MNRAMTETASLIHYAWAFCPPAYTENATGWHAQAIEQVRSAGRVGARS